MPNKDVNSIPDEKEEERIKESIIKRFNLLSAPSTLKGTEKPKKKTKSTQSKK